MRCRHDHRALADSARPLINLASSTTGDSSLAPTKTARHCYTFSTRSQSRQRPRAPHSKELPMFRNLFGKKATRKSASARTNHFRAQYDTLEDRLAMSSSAVYPVASCMSQPRLCSCRRRRQSTSPSSPAMWSRVAWRQRNVPILFVSTAAGRLSAIGCECTSDRNCRLPDEHPQQQRDGTGYERTQHTLRLPRTCERHILRRGHRLSLRPTRLGFLSTRIAPPGSRPGERKVWRPWPRRVPCTPS